MNRKIIFLIVCVLSLSGCKKEEKIQTANSKLKVSVTILPYADFVNRIGGKFVEVNTLVPPGASPESYEPEPLKLIELGKSDAYLLTSSILGFENSLTNKIKSENKNFALIDLSKGIKIIDNNPHVWLGIKEVRIISENICDYLVSKMPEEKEYFLTNKSKFITQLDSADNFIKNIVEQMENKAMLVYHPAWGYFANDYGLEEIAIEKDGNNPKASDIAKLIDKARVLKIKTVFMEKQFDSSPAKTIADEIGAKIEFIDPVPTDFIKNLYDIAEKLKRSEN
ncbi:MAG: zinc ABC transporter substrate-binding protein [Melioribacteraceae bacterium]|nr:zinc ABC transporter substrate-binding protein [Melioribacteraceae bacterium]